MKLGLQLGYWGAQPNPFARRRSRRRPSGSASTRCGPPRRGAPTRSRRSAWIGAHTERIRLCTGHRADLGAHAGVVRDARAHARPPLERPLHARPRRLGSAGRRGLVRPAVRQAARAHARVHRDRAPRAARARSRSSSQGEHYRHAVRRPGLVGARQAAASRSRIRCAPTSRSCSAPKVRRTSRSRPRSPTAGCRSTTRRSGPRCTPTRCGAAQARLRDLRDRDGLRDHRRHRGGADADQGRARVLHRRHGRQATATSTWS